MITRLHTIFKYDNFDSLVVLYKDLLTDQTIDVGNLSTIFSRILYHNLIELPVEWMPRWVYKIMPKHWQFAVCQQIGASLMDSNQLRPAFNKVIHHMLSGVDLTDRRSAGGWNEREFKTFLTILSDNGYYYDGDPTWLIAKLEQSIAE